MMFGTYQILIPLLSLFFVREDLTDFYPMTQKVELIRFFDADTALVRFRNQRLKVRLSKIDAPEKGQPLINGGDAGMESLSCVQSILAKKKEFNLRIYKLDLYGRVLGELDDLSFEFVRKGCVALYPYAQFENQQEKWRFLRAFFLAKKEGLGLWKFGGYRQPKLWRTSKRILRQR